MWVCEWRWALIVLEDGSLVQTELRMPTRVGRSIGCVSNYLDDLMNDVSPVGTTLLLKQRGNARSTLLPLHGVQRYAS